jgi:hypothetical protein
MSVSWGSGGKGIFMVRWMFSSFVMLGVCIHKRLRGPITCLISQMHTNLEGVLQLGPLGVLPYSPRTWWRLSQVSIFVAVFVKEVAAIRCWRWWQIYAEFAAVRSFRQFWTVKYGRPMKVESLKDWFTLFPYFHTHRLAGWYDHCLINLNCTHGRVKRTQEKLQETRTSELYQRHKLVNLKLETIDFTKRYAIVFT